MNPPLLTLASGGSEGVQITHVRLPPGVEMNVRTLARIGSAVGGISMVFSLLCLVVVAAFTAAAILAVLFGTISSGIAWAMGARRTARVALVLSFVPACEWLLLDQMTESVGTLLLALVPLVLALGFAVWMLVDYFRRRSPLPGA
jgi:hypothetical protein